ncbi:MAG: hypothetical protein GWM92_15850, partial [Gemmatimonadetes bacterium]|nr:hypothetical protein [Gemmatimonadota bacterium]NIR80204.1 hypothetical protein [Gemmatimonadota bacterium]NIT88969.1 hypothetical protein [Gemmatimonadota bacterium]NIU32765.1 hypothetical protein [Gemmatimonadota bacterium]NIU37196.1 hypothetical protein [Gemmatimonadota bacterium]
IWHDDGVYALIGRALASGEGLRYGGVAGALPAAKFPPLYPLTLAGVWTVLPDASRAVPLMEVFNLAFLAAAGALFARMLHRRLEFEPGWAVATGALAFLSFELWRVARVPLSEALFVLALVAGAGAAARLDARPEDRRGLVLFLALFALAFHVRTAGIVLAVAAAAGLLLRASVRRALVVGAGAVLIVLPWTLWSRRAAAEIPGPLRDVLGPYGGWLLGQMVDAPGLYFGTLHGQAVALLRQVTGLLVPLPPGSGTWGNALVWGGLGILAPALILGADRIWRRSPSLLFLVGGYLALIWLWPFRDVRLVVPILPFVVLLVVEGFRWEGEGAEPVGGRASKGTDASGARDEGTGGVIRLRKAWRAAGVAWGAAFALLSCAGLLRGWGEGPYRVRALALGRALEAVEEHTLPGAVVGAPELWSGIGIHSGRTVVPSARFLPRRSEGPLWGTPPEQFALWELAGVDFLLVEHGGRVHGEALERLRSVCGGEAARAVERWPGARLVKLAWDAGCRERLSG